MPYTADKPGRTPSAEELRARERSVEHARLTPAFGATLPPQGLSGVLRRKTFTYGEGRAAHWIILLAADRVDVVESNLRDLAHRRVSNPIATGLRSELTHHGVRSRVGKRRADVNHQWMDPIVTAGPVAVAAVGAVSRPAGWSRAAERCSGHAVTAPVLSVSVGGDLRRVDPRASVPRRGRRVPQPLPAGGPRGRPR